MTHLGEGQTWPGVWPGILVAFVLTFGAVFWPQPLPRDRPTDVGAGLPALGAEDVDARLWQDPFAAVDAARKAADKAPARGGAAADHAHTIEWLGRQIADRPADRVEVLAVLVPGGSSIGSAEWRRRNRYAVLSGLMSARRLPDDPEHIGYVEPGPQGPPDYVPFEWFSSPRGEDSPDCTGPDLLLLWIDQGGLMRPAKGPVPGAAAPDPSPAGTGQTPGSGPGSQPTDQARTIQGQAGNTPPDGPRILARLSGLLSDLCTRSGNRCRAERIRFSVIGPADSTGLVAIADEYRRYTRSDPDCASNKAGPTAIMWSPFATTPDVTTIPENPCGVRGRGGDGCEGHCVTILPPGPGHRLIADDRVLVDLLIAELKRRGVREHSAVALVGQWDTDYSRALARSFEDAWTPGGNVLRFNYMRGLDGAVPGDKSSQPERDQAKRIERAAGDAQLDYLRRLASDLLVQHAGLRAKCSLGQRFRQDCGIRAIGVLGNDYFDKLLVLRALKPVFGNAIFFTTDLDADMLHPEDNKWTRNLLVASGFGLTLDDDLQGAVAPLRDSYQAALLLAVHGALQTKQFAGLEIPPPARLFEIGRTSAVELVSQHDLRNGQGFLRPDARPRAAQEERQWQPVSAHQDPHPQRELNAYYRPFLGQTPVALVAPVAALSLAMVLVAIGVGLDRVTELLKQLLRSPIAMGFVAFGVLLVLLLAVGAALDLAAGGEPFSLLQGVSVWPAEGLRLLAGLMALTFLFIGHRRLCRERTEIERDFRLLPDEQWPEAGDEPESGTSPGGSLGVSPRSPGPGSTGDAAAADGQAEGSAQSQPAGTGSVTKGSEDDRAEAGCGSDPAAGPAGERSPRSVTEVWRCYLARCRERPRWLIPQDLRHSLTQHCAAGWDRHSVTTRVTVQVVLFFLLALALMVWLGFPNRPVRSVLAWSTDLAMILLVLIPFLALLFYMIDATRQTLVLARELAGPVQWPTPTLANFGLARWGSTPAGKLADTGSMDWLDVHLIARVSRAVGNLVWYPVLVLIVLALARHAMLDALDLPPALVIVMLLALLSMIGCAWALRSGAERVRGNALRNLGLARLRAQGETGQAACITQLDTLLKWVAEERDGAFRPFTQQPVLHALLAFLSSVSGLALIEYSSMLNL